MKIRLTIIGLLFLTGLLGLGVLLQHKTLNVTLRDAETNQPVTRAELTSNVATVDHSTNDAFAIPIRTNPLRETTVVPLDILAPGYRPGTLRVAVPRWHWQPRLDITVEPTRITGRVVDHTTNQPLADVYLGSRLETQPQITVTNRFGRFAFQRLWVDDFIIVEPPLGYLPVDPVALRVVDLSERLQIRLQPTIITGSIVSLTGTPRSGIRLTAGTGERQQTVTTNQQGQFVFTRLTASDVISLQSPEYLPLTVPVSQTDALTLTIEPYKLQLTVWDSYRNQPMSEAQVTVENRITTTTNPQGQVELTHLPPSSRLLISKAGYHTITLAYRGETDLALEMVLGRLQGFVIDEATRQPLSGTLVYLGDTASRADGTGRFEIGAEINQPTRLTVKRGGYRMGHALFDRRGVLTPTVANQYNNVTQQWLTPQPCADPPPGPPCFTVSLNRFVPQAIYVPFYRLRDRTAMLAYLDLIDASAELNAIIVDVKSDYGEIGWQTEVALAQEIGAVPFFAESWFSLEAFLAEAKRRNIYTIARFVVFKDDPLARGRPDLAVVDDTGAIWIDGERLAWANPFREAVWQYNIDLAAEVAALGFDELNLDYIRFPSDGNVLATRYEEDNTAETRTAAIRAFMHRLSERLQSTPIFLSADVFGLTVWVPPQNDMNIGQRVIDLTPYLDYLAPMVYPSTFAAGTLGYDDPFDYPYEMVYRSQREAIKRVPPHVKVRPWLQAYWYDLAEMAQLRQAARDAQADGWAWWNAAGLYDAQLFE